MASLAGLFGAQGKLFISGTERNYSQMPEKSGSCEQCLYCYYQPISKERLCLFVNPPKVVQKGSTCESFVHKYAKLFQSIF